ncbi:MAG: phospholipase [Pirellulales bacterium]|nr:phospholipase [Pirellulales bacterium]
MSFQISVLNELHRIHQQLSDLRERLERGPKQIRARQANVVSAEQKLQQAKHELQASRIAADQKQLQLKSGEAKILDLNKKFNAAQSTREYQALKDQIAASEMANSVLQDEILEILEKIDTHKRLVGESEQNIVKAKEELAKVESLVKEQEPGLQAEYQRVDANLKTAEATLPEEYRDPYHRIVHSKGADALAQIENDSCSGCFQQQTANVMNSLLLNKVVFCKSCGRMLYLPEDRGRSLKKNS